MFAVDLTAARLKAGGVKPATFVSPNVPEIAKDHKLRVFDAYTEKLNERCPVEFAKR